MVRWYVSYCTYDICSNLGYHNLPTLCEVRHFSIKSRKRRPIRIVTAELLKRSDREAIDFLSVSLAELSKGIPNNNRYDLAAVYRGLIV